MYVLSSIEIAGDLEIDHLHMGVNRAYQLPHAGVVLFINDISLTLDLRGGVELGREFAQGTLAGNPLLLPLPIRLPATPPRTHDAGLDGQWASQSFQHL